MIQISHSLIERTLSTVQPDEVYLEAACEMQHVRLKLSY